MNEIIKRTCGAISSKDIDSAKKVISLDYPFLPLKNSGRRYSDFQKTKIFFRDGFIDRYSGDKLVFPPVLRILSKLMPEEFPFHKNWKTDECHIAYWELLPTIDHIVPISRGGVDNDSNWVCTSQLRNSAKSNWLLEELNWELHSAGALDDWDGMLTWYIAYIANNPAMLEDKYLKSWFNATKLLPINL